MCVRSHQETDPRDHLGVVDLQPGLIEVEAGVGHVEHADAEDEPQQAGRDGSEGVAAASKGQLFKACVRTCCAHVWGKAQDLLAVPHQQAAHPGKADHAPRQVE